MKNMNINSYENNKEAISLDMLTDSRREKEANLAKDSGDYTIAGPYELVQGEREHFCLTLYMLIMIVAASSGNLP